MKFRKRIFSLLLAGVTLMPFMQILSSCTTPETQTPTLGATTLAPTDTVTVETEKTPTVVPESSLAPTTEPAVKYEENPLLEITEIMYANFVTVADSDGEYTPWIEFHNKSNLSIKLSDYTISLDNGEKIALPDISLPSSGYAFIFANGKTTANSISMNLGTSGKLTVYHGDLVAQTVSFTNITKNCSFIVSNGSETKLPTPGYTEVKAKDNILISELMSSNSLYPVKGVDCDWIEIYNDSQSDIDLSDYYMSTDADNLFEARLPDIILKKGEYTVICCQIDVPFNLSKSGESIYVTRRDGVLAASVTFEAIDKNYSWTCDHGIVDYPTPGYANNPANNLKVITERKGLVISEVISSNTKYSPISGKYYDIVELYNNSDKAINLSEYYLSDKGSDLQRYQLPDKTLAQGEYIIVHCDSDATGTAPFGISSSGENLFVSRTDGYIVDAVAVPEIPTDRSWGRTASGLVYFATPTLGSENGTGYDSITQAPIPSVKSGIYTEAQSVFFIYEGTVYYTTDGSTPTKSSKVYTGEIIKVESTTAIRLVAYNGDKIPSETVTYNYLIDIPDYTLPVIKLSTSDEEMFGEKGIYTNYNGKNEITGNIAMYVDGNEEFSVNCGIKIFGAYSRRFLKKSLQIEFRKEYGTSRLEYPLFGEGDIASFSNIVLRSGSQASYTTDTMFTDEFMTSLAYQSGNMPSLMVQSYRPCNLYINGEYYGVYFIREKIDDDFIADNLGVAEDSVTIIDGYNTLKYGSSSQGWNTIWQKIYTKKIDFSNDENYKWLADQINLESYADMIIMRAYSGDLDPGNIRFFKSPEYDGGRWNFILYDNDMSFRSNAAAKTRLDKFLNHSDFKKTHALFRALMENDQFKEFFLGRLATHLKTTLLPENVGKRIDSIVAELEADMPYQIARWKFDSFYMPNMTRWYKNIDYMRSLTTDERIGWFVQDAVTAMGLSKDDVAKYMGEEFVRYIED